MRLSRRGLVRGAVLLSALRQIGCASESDRPGARDDGPSPEPAAGADGSDVPDSGPSLPSSTVRAASTTQRKRRGECAAVPTAWVLAGDGAAAPLLSSLASFGFDAQALPLDKTPLDLIGMIVIPSFITDDPTYALYVQQYAGDLREFVDQANVLIELPQRVEREVEPPFLPLGYGTRRETAIVSGVQIQVPDNAILRSLESDQGLLSWQEPEEGTPVFAGADSFEILLADPIDQRPLLIETAYGQGRFLLSALAFDQQTDPAQAKIATTIFGNLFDYVRSVCMRTAGALRLTSKRPSMTFTEGSSMLVALPDTQFYSLRFPGLFHAQTSWIREQAGPRDIKYVLHLGDIVNNNTQLEWQRASVAMSMLHGIVPYALAPGNHDYGPSGNAATRDTLMNEHFSFAHSADMPTFGEAYRSDYLDSSYHVFEIQGRKFVVIALEWAPRDEVVEWADQIMTRFPDHEGILITHAYLSDNDRRHNRADTENRTRNSPYSYRTPGPINDGEQLWQKLVKKHRFAMTLNGHVLGDGCGYLASTTDRGNVCHQMLSNYQMRDQGGEAYMRLLEFLPDGNTVRVCTYSPLFDAFLDVPGHNFTITLS